ncbi:hypothetical protein [Curtobacterium sp. MCBA15_001]|uniref:hypothetical protein n=1 Tax=Curtobacterium sp. MCBA15_001 TaxID=1898731 RepID=UPI0011139AB9|nr:hypothetical protein [Curtobacterium sp. MCBA15_001]
MYIQRFWSKVAFIAAVIVGYFGLGLVMRFLDVPFATAATARGIALVMAVIAGGRLFRGRDEATGSRPWWKMTARPFLSGALFVLSFLSTLICFGSFVHIWSGSSQIDSFLIGSVTGVLTAITLLYGLSFFKLMRAKRHLRNISNGSAD